MRAILTDIETNKPNALAISKAHGIDYHSAWAIMGKLQQENRK